MSRGLGFVQASILKYLSEQAPEPFTPRELCAAIYVHEDEDEDRDIDRHLPAVRRALYGLEELDLVECIGEWQDDRRRSGRASRLWKLTSAGHERAERGLVINIPRHDARDREVQSARDALVAYMREQNEQHVREVFERVNPPDA